MLLGYYTLGSRAAMTTYPSGRTSQFFFFGQDDIRVNDKLTLNLGLRWEYYSPVKDAHNNQANFDLATGDILLACVATSCAAGVNPDLRDWSPRVGFAYTPDRGKTALRGPASRIGRPSPTRHLRRADPPATMGPTAAQPERTRPSLRPRSARSPGHLVGSGHPD